MCRTVGLIVDGAQPVVTMVVPGGPAHREGTHGKGRRIEKGDMVVAIDPDGDSGLTRVTDANVIQLLRGTDTVGSLVTLQILKRVQPSASGRASMERCETRSILL